MPSAQPSTPLVPDFDILINGSPLSVEMTSHVIGVTVEEDVMLPSMFEIEMTGSASRASDIEWLDDANFAIGNEVQVRIGYANDLATIIIGEITTLEPEFAQNRAPSLTIRGYDRRHRLQRGCKTRTFTQQKDSDIAAKIASEANLTAQATDSKVVHEYVLQANQTDLAFLQNRARSIQYEVVVENKTLLFRPVGNAASEILTLNLESDLLEFYPRLSSMQQVSEVTVQGWNFKGKQGITGQAKGGAEVSRMGGQKSGAGLVESTFGASVQVISDRPIFTQAEADQIAKAHFNQKVLALISGEGLSFGRTDIKPGKVIKIDGISQRFSGQYYVTTVSHRYRPAKGYYTHFTVQRNAT
ncbi:MAG TPA: contractile injection system protein, VgrG/Pvc8 family [Allocoleopsis sp.]